MSEGKTRFTLDMDTLFQKRLMAALKGVSMQEYCLSAIDRELARDEGEGAKSLPFGDEALNRLVALQNEVFQGRQVPGDSEEIIREAREARTRAQ